MKAGLINLIIETEGIEEEAEERLEVVLEMEVEGETEDEGKNEKEGYETQGVLGDLYFLTRDA